MIRTKRIFEHKSPEDGYRILVERNWPKGVRREEGKVDFWMRKLAPSSILTHWFSRTQRWDEFVKLYREELKKKIEMLRELKKLEREKGVITLLYIINNPERNPAVVLKDVVENLDEFMKEGEEASVEETKEGGTEEAEEEGSE
ncbi:DUF488 domain-containing protein [Methanosarcinales archaeon]|nr:MAG: DUF488 domain-containing protein [Methanosarcinales archaeon]